MGIGTKVHKLGVAVDGNEDSVVGAGKTGERDVAANVEVVKVPDLAGPRGDGSVAKGVLGTTGGTWLSWLEDMVIGFCNGFGFFR